ncbi:MAG TPA: DUF1080 domain-containing protein [Tepidisphaeraceae bacterium]|jgi:hypothetical protein|nr:DUF1080 domain-containing protein [Tepidisphaeraceae bacterium]
MNRRRSLSIAASLMLLAAAALVASGDDASQAQPDKDGFYSLFNGKDLDGWKVGANAASWSVQDGQIVVHGKGPSHLFYVGPTHNHDWKDFYLKAEVMTYPHANSGIYFHTKYQESRFPDKGFECQIDCTHSDMKKTGSLYDVVDTDYPHHKDNEWFLYEIIVKGNHVVLKVNGEVACDWHQPDDFKSPKGHADRVIDHGTIALQGHDPGSECHFKSILIKPLE